MMIPKSMTFPLRMYKTFQKLFVCLAFLNCSVVASPPLLLPRNTTPASPSQSDLETELGSSLSKNASLYFPGSSQFTNLTARWTENITPDFVVSVEVGTEEDVATTVRPQHAFSEVSRELTLPCR